MNPDFHPIVNGIYILLAVQLFLIACVRIFSKTENRLPLALLCLVCSEWFFRRFFWDVWPNYDLLIILIGGYKELFIGPLLYLHFKLKEDNKNVKLVASHLSLPIVVLTIYVVLRLFFYEGIYDETKLLRYRLHMALLLFSYGTYFILSLKAIKNLKGIFLPRVRWRAKSILLIIIGYQLLTWTLSLLSHLANYVFTTPSWQYVNGTIIYNLHWWLQIPLLCLCAILLIVYTISETPSIKKFILPQDSRIPVTSSKVQREIDEKIRKYFVEQKIHKDLDLDQQKCLKSMEVSRNDFAQYMKDNGFTNFSEFLNRFRVEEFKLLIHQNEHARYDLVSLAQLAGFNSKATFNRVFRKFERMTPSDYVKQHNLPGS